MRRCVINRSAAIWCLLLKLMISVVAVGWVGVWVAVGPELGLDFEAHGKGGGAGPVKGI